MRVADFCLISAGVLLNAFAQLGLKSATRVTGPVSLTAAGWQQLTELLAATALWWALAAYALSVVIWLIALSRVPVGQAYPLLSMGYVVNIGLAWWLIGEIPNLERIVGVAVIVVGVLLVARS